MLSSDYIDEEDLLNEVRDVLIDEIKYREYTRQKEQDEHAESLMNIEPQPEITQEKQRRRKGKKFTEAIQSQHQKIQQRINERREQEAHTEALMNMEPQPEIKQKKQMRRKGKKFIEAIKSQHQKRQQRINKLHEIYNNQRDKEEGTNQ